MNDRVAAIAEEVDFSKGADRAAPCILVVDDDPAFRYLCARALQTGGAYRVREAECIASAMELVKAADEQDPIDGVLIDYGLPDGDGMSLMASIREARPDWYAPMVVMTSGGSEHVATEALRAGAADYMPKHAVSPPSLLRALGNAIEKSSLRRAHDLRREELESANSLLQRRNDEIARFYHNVSHEIKTPLTAATIFMSMLEKAQVGELTQQQHEVVSQALRSCRQVADHLNDLIDCTRLEAGQLTLKPALIDIYQVVERGYLVAESAALESGVQLSKTLAADLPQFYADDGRLVQVIANLLGNAVKFTPCGGQVQLRVWQEQQTLIMEIADTGIGIAPEDLARVFDRLYQVQEKGDASHGTGLGLGLSIAREIVALHDGRISARSELNQGTTFRVKIPMQTGPADYVSTLALDPDPQTNKPQDNV